MAYPFIIWTMRRTGGTNLAHALFSMSKCEMALHEPFNIDREYGFVTLCWNEKHDEEELYGEIDSILSRKILFKHCLEIMPQELNIALIDVSLKYGYKHLFLYRENATRRLLSLNFSQKTGIWGKDSLDGNGARGSSVGDDIPVDDLIRHEMTSRRKMNNVYLALEYRGVSPLQIRFEQLYCSDMEDASRVLEKVFGELIDDTQPPGEGFLEQTLQKGELGLKDQYLRFPNADEFVRRADQLPAFSLPLPQGMESERILVKIQRVLLALPRRVYRFLKRRMVK